MIYLIQRIEGKHDDYAEVPVKAYESKLLAEKICKYMNADLVFLLKKYNEFDKKVEKYYNDNIFMSVSNEDYEKWVKNTDKEEKEILSAFKWEKLKYINQPIFYDIIKIPFVKRGY